MAKRISKRSSLQRKKPKQKAALKKVAFKRRAKKPVVQRHASHVTPVSPLSLMRRIGDKIFGRTEVVTHAKLLDFLSEFLAVEKGGIELYSGAVERSTDPKIKTTFSEYLAQTRRHAELLTRAILEIGGDPGYESPGAKIQKKRAESMLTLEVPGELRELQDAENLLIAETKDHADWEFLSKISSKIENAETRSIIEEIVGEVEDQEDEHLKFAREAVDDLTMKLALSSEAEEIERQKEGSQRVA